MPRYNGGRKRVRWLLSKWQVDPTVKGGEDIKKVAEEVAREKQGKCMQKLSIWGFKLKKYIYTYDPRMYVCMDSACVVHVW